MALGERRLARPEVTGSRRRRRPAASGREPDRRPASRRRRPSAAHDPRGCFAPGSRGPAMTPCAHDLVGLLLEAAQPTGLGDVGHHLAHPGPRRGRGGLREGTRRWSIRSMRWALSRLGVLEHDDVAGVVDQHVLGAGDRLDDELTVRRRREHVLTTVEHQHLACRNCASTSPLVVAVEGLEVAGDHVDRVPSRMSAVQRDHEPRHRRGERVPVDEEQLDVPADPTRPCSTRVGRWASWPAATGPSRSSRPCRATVPRRPPMAGQPPGLVADEARPPMTRSRNSSGLVAASAMIVMPPMEWPTSTRSLGGDGLDDACQVAAELVDGGCARRRDRTGRARAGPRHHAVARVAEGPALVGQQRRLRRSRG